MLEEGDRLKSGSPSGLGLLTFKYTSPRSSITKPPSVSRIDFVASLI